MVGGDIVGPDESWAGAALHQADGDARHGLVFLDDLAPNRSSFGEPDFVHFSPGGQQLDDFLGESRRLNLDTVAAIAEVAGDEELAAEVGNTGRIDPRQSAAPAPVGPFAEERADDGPDHGLARAVEHPAAEHGPFR